MTKISDLSTATPDAANDSIPFLDASDTTNSAQGTVKRAAPDAFGLLVAANNLSDLNSVATARENLGLAIGSDVQAWDDDLDDIAALTPTKGNVLVGDGTDWTALGVGSDDEVLTADAAQPKGVKWAAAAGGGASDVDDLTTDTGNAAEMLRVDGAGTGLEYRTAAQVLSDIGAVDVTGDTVTGTLAIEVATGSVIDALTLKTTDGSGTGRLVKFLDSSGSLMSYIDHKGRMALGSATVQGATLHVTGVALFDGVANPILIQHTATAEAKIQSSGATGDAGFKFENTNFGDEHRILHVWQDAFKIDHNTNTILYADSNDDFFIGGGTSPSAQLHVDQPSATGAQPVLLLDQADVSEEMIEFVSSEGVGNAIEAVGAKLLTVTEFIKVTINGNTRYIQAGTIA
jgi:hypothetical protein